MHVASRLVFAHIRASSGSTVQQTNCHPFRHGRWLWMHNGHLGDFAAVKRDLASAVALQWLETVNADRGPAQPAGRRRRLLSFEPRRIDSRATRPAWRSPGICWVAGLAGAPLLLALILAVAPAILGRWGLLST